MSANNSTNNTGSIFSRLRQLVQNKNQPQAEQVVSDLNFVSDSDDFIHITNNTKLNEREEDADVSVLQMAQCFSNYKMYNQHRSNMVANVVVGKTGASKTSANRHYAGWSGNRACPEPELASMDEQDTDLYDDKLNRALKYSTKVNHGKKNSH